MSIDQLLTIIVPLGWFVPVTPGTRFVTVGGAVASDIHGKNHHRDGSFGSHVTNLRMMLADTSIVDVGPNRNPDLFWATIGGMGLTGVVIDVTLQMIPIETSRIVVETRRIDNLDEILSEMVAAEARHRYSVAWIDMMANGTHLGRGILTEGDHARLNDLDQSTAAAPLRYAAGQLLKVPSVVPPAGLINRASAAAFNELWFRTAPRERIGEIQSISQYFHPLDFVADWNRIYGRGGFIQYQFVVPVGAEPMLRTAIELISKASLPIFLTVLKRFGPGNLAPMSFPTEGWTLAVDVPARCPGLSELLCTLDRLVLDAGGRHYLAKDSHMRPEAVRRGYPRLDEWLAVRSRVDPTGLWASDLGRRLCLGVRTV